MLRDAQLRGPVPVPMLGIEPGLTPPAPPSGPDLNPLNHLDWGVLGRELRLTEQEMKVVQHILAGQKLTRIAADMGLGLGTVKTYSQRIYRKLHVSTHCALATAVFGAWVQHERDRAAAPATPA